MPDKYGNNVRMIHKKLYSLYSLVVALVIDKEFRVNGWRNNNKNNTFNSSNTVVNMKNICLITAVLSLTVKYRHYLKQDS